MRSGSFRHTGNGIPGLAALASLKHKFARVGKFGKGRIPGLAALASLKLRSYRAIASRLGPDSGACCPGLIEANDFEGNDQYYGWIPGLAALASLKLGMFYRQQCDARKDSGACCPGLIEAIATGRPQTQ